MLEKHALRQSEKEMFEDKLARVVRRTFINDELKKLPEQPEKDSENVFSVRAKVRSQEGGHAVAEIIKQLTSETYAIEKNIFNLSGALFEELNKEYPFVSGIILLGSGVHGGGQVRSIVGATETDLDWGILYKSSEKPTEEERHAIYVSSEAIIATIREHFDFPDSFKSCPVINSKTLCLPEVTAPLELDKDNQQISTYFLPTVPKEVGESNIQFILQSFESMKKEDLLELLDKLESMWLDFSRLKMKHFSGYSGDRRTVGITQYAVRESGYVLFNPFTMLKRIYNEEQNQQ